MVLVKYIADTQITKFFQSVKHVVHAMRSFVCQEGMCVKFLNTRK
jgi:hypothetical protein